MPGRDSFDQDLFHTTMKRDDMISTTPIWGPACRQCLRLHGADPNKATECPHNIGDNICAYQPINTLNSRNVNMISTDFQCPRCHQHVRGFFNEHGTIGYYDLNSPIWRKYAKPYEDLVCDHCMWASEQFQKDFPSLFIHPTHVDYKMRVIKELG